MNTRLEGGCQVPIGSYAELTNGDSLWLRALVGAPDGSQMVRGERRGKGRKRPNSWAFRWRKSCWRTAPARFCADVYNGEPPA